MEDVDRLEFIRHVFNKGFILPNNKCTFAGLSLSQITLDGSLHSPTESQQSTGTGTGRVKSEE